MNELLGREIAGLLFDADGTLLDTHDLILSSMRYTINEGCNESYSDAELMRGVGTPLPDQMLAFANGDAQKADELVITYRAHNDIIHDAGICTFPDTRAALERFRARGFTMGVVTSKRHELAERGLELTGIAEFFDVLIAPDDWPEHKPAPGPILRECELLGFLCLHRLFFCRSGSFCLLCRGSLLFVSQTLTNQRCRILFQRALCCLSLNSFFL